MDNRELISNLLYIFNNVNYWLEYSEKKLTYITSFFSILSGISIFLIDKFENSRFIIIGTLILFIISILSIYFLLISLIPITDINFFKKKSNYIDYDNDILIFYKHISKYDFIKYKEAFSKRYNIKDLDSNQYALDIINQILINSKIAARKYNMANKVIIIIIIGISIYLIMLLLYFLYKYLL